MHKQNVKKRKLELNHNNDYNKKELSKLINNLTWFTNNDVKIDKETNIVNYDALKDKIIEIHNFLRINDLGFGFYGLNYLIFYTVLGLLRTII